MRSLDSVRSYFNREATRFDAIYEADKPLLQRIGDAIMRGVIAERFQLVMNSITATGQSVLDVGCGSGRYGVAIAKRGAARCMGIDVSEDMIAIARKASDENAVADRCAWEVTDFLSWKSQEVYDSSIAMGYFDYLEDPLPHLERMIRQTRGQVFISFPKRWEIRVPVRMLRFKLESGFVRFYSRTEVVELFKQAGKLEFLSLVDLGRDYIAIYNCDASQVQSAQGR